MMDEFLKAFQKKKAAKVVYDMLKRYKMFDIYTGKWSKLSLLCTIEIRHAVQCAMVQDLEQARVHLERAAQLHNVGMGERPA
jgi:hypothetical protein